MKAYYKTKIQDVFGSEGAYKKGTKQFEFQPWREIAKAIFLEVIIKIKVNKKTNENYNYNSHLS